MRDFDARYFKIIVTLKRTQEKGRLMRMETDEIRAEVVQKQTSYTTTLKAHQNNYRVENCTREGRIMR
jgi:hypothetical protein